MEKLVFLFLIISTIAIAEGRYLAKREENTGSLEATPAEVIPDVKEQEVAPAGSEVKEQEAPAGSEVKEQEAPAGSEVKEQEAPAGSEVKEQEAPAGSEVNEKEAPAESEAATEVVNGDSNKSDANETGVKNRFGFNYNRGQAMAVGPAGMGMSQATTYGMNMGIMRPGMGYQPLYGQSGGYANTMSTGMHAPMTYAGGYNRGGMGGMMSGYYGGRGQAMSNSYSMYQRIPMGMDGTALYSNFKKPSNKEGADNAADTPENGEVGQSETTNEEPAEEVTKTEQEQQGEETANDQQPLVENEAAA